MTATPMDSGHRMIVWVGFFVCLFLAILVISLVAAGDANSKRTNQRYTLEIKACEHARDVQACIKQVENPYG